MTGRILRLSPIALVFAAAACGGGGGAKTVTVTQPSTTTTPTTTAPTTSGPSGSTKLRLYFLHDGKVQPVERAVPRTAGVAGAAFLALRRGPTPAEAALGLTSAVAPTSGAVIGSPATLSLTTKQPPSSDALAQLVFTLTQFPGRTSVEINGKEYRRADFEAQSPAILVESPLPFQTVRSPLRMTGTANTFEATFQYELKDAAGTVLAKHFVTATSGNGIRGTFDVTTPFAVAKAGPGTLTVYENDAATGKRINQVDIPVALVPGAPTPS